MQAGFNYLDHLVLFGYLIGLVLVAMIFIKEQKNTSDFFVASRSVPYWAVGMSILATLVSAVSITGAPADFSRYGLRGFGVWWLATFLAFPIIVLVFVRFFVNLKLMTAYEYLEKRFSITVRLCGSIFFMLMRGLYLGVVLYASALIIRPAMGDAVGIVPLIVLIGFFAAIYAVIGGMKSVIWTDVIQLIVVYLGITYLLIDICCHIEGGPARIWQVATDTDRDFSYLKGSDYWNWDLFNPNSFWLLLIGFFFSALAQRGTDQLTVQRYLSTANVRESAKALLVDTLGGIPMGLILTFIGMAIFAFYELNPAKTMPEPNLLLADYITRELPHGLLGLFVAAIAAAIISTVDSGYNSLATVTMTDFQQRFGKRQMSDREAVRWARLWTIFWAVISIVLGIFISVVQNDTIGRVSTQVLGLFSGSLLGIFMLGMISTRANARGVIVGAVTGAIIAVYASYFWVRTGEEGQVQHVAFVLPTILGTLCTLIVGYLASFLFAPPAVEKLDNLTLWSLKK